jgi:hypothetical protein
MGKRDCSPVVKPVSAVSRMIDNSKGNTEASLQMANQPFAGKLLSSKGVDEDTN